MIVRAKFVSWVFATSSVAALATASPAWAASAPASQDEVETIVVTGSAIRGTPENAAMPVEAINLEQLEKTGSPSNVDLIKRLTESGGVQGETNRNAPLPIGAASINLRSLGPGKTVVLFNNRRWGDQYSATVGVGRFNNIAQIPNAVIGRVEVLKDGGNAIYGADAVGGIVNYISRKKFNGLELNANYRAISGEKGDRGASVLWGKVFDRGNVMIGLDYDHRSELKANARDWTQRPYLDSVTVLGYAWNTSGSPGAYIVQDRRDNTTGAPAAAFSSITTNQPATGLGFNRYAGDRQIGSTGLVRDKACTDLGGFAGFNTASAPICYYHPVQFDNLVEEQNTYSAYIEADYQVAPWLKWHGEGYYYTLDMPRIAVGASDPLFSYPIGQDGCSIAPTGVGTAQNCGGTAGYSVPGSNPAVADFLNKYNNINMAGTAYTPAQIAAVTTGAGPGGSGLLGRVFLTGGVWRPFGMGGNPLTGGADFQHNSWRVFRTAQEFSGTLPQVAGWDLSFSGAGTYQRTIYEVKTRDMLVDRLQQALNGLGGAGCDANPATPNVVEGGVPGVGACKWFNPFSSAIAGNPITGQANPGYVAALANDPAMVQWLYVPLSLKRDSTLWVGDFVFNGRGGLSLWGGPVAFALGGQYRWQQESELVNSFSDKGIQRYDGTTVGGSNPCPTVGVTDCSTPSRTGAIVFNRSVGGVRKNSTRTYPAWGAFAEVNLPILKTLTLDIAGRYERYSHDLTGTSEGVLVGAGSVKWQVTPWAALRATGGNTFYNNGGDTVNVLRTTTTTSAVLPSFGGVTGGVAAVSPAPLLESEVGFNYNVGGIVTLGGFRATIDYFNIRIRNSVRAFTADALVAGVVQPGQLGAGARIDCASALLDSNPLFQGPQVKLAGFTSGDQHAFCNGIAGGATAANTLGAGSELRYFNAVNGSGLQTSGIDARASYRFDNVFGGPLILSADATWIRSYDVDPFYVGGVLIAPGYSGVGSLNEATGKNSQHIARWRGNVSIDYSVGRHSLNWTTRFVSGMFDDSSTRYAAPGAAQNSNIGGANGATSAALCPATYIVAPPLPANAGTGTTGSLTGTGTATQIGYVAACNTVNFHGQKLPVSYNTDLTYRLTLNNGLSISLTIYNLFDAEPAYSRCGACGFTYDSTTGSPLGRNLKINLTKRW